MGCWRGLQVVASFALETYRFGGSDVARVLGLIGVPSSMGAFAPGQEKGPGALRDADLLGRLACAGVEVADYGDGGRVQRWRPDKDNRRAQNLPNVVEVLQSQERGLDYGLYLGHDYQRSTQQAHPVRRFLAK